MLNKLKENIRRKLISFLRIDSVERSLNENFIKVNEKATGIEYKQDLHARILNKHDERIHALHDTVQSVVSIGSDISPSRYGDSSWAVVCIEGKYNIVKFINLDGKSAREMLHILKQFEGGRSVHDAPMGYLPKDVFIDWNI